MTSSIAERKKEEMNSTNGGEHTRSKKVFVPRADVYEKQEAIFVLADMPGVNENSIDITLEKNVLTIQGFVTSPAADGMRLVHCECPEGDYRRVFLLSEEVDRDGIQASVKNGVLKLVLPKSPTSSARKIAVKSE